MTHNFVTLDSTAFLNILGQRVIFVFGYYISMTGVFEAGVLYLHWKNAVELQDPFEDFAKLCAYPWLSKGMLGPSEWLASNAPISVHATANHLLLLIGPQSPRSYLDFDMMQPTCLRHPSASKVSISQFGPSWCHHVQRAEAMLNGMFGCGGATSSTSPAQAAPSSNLPRALQIAANRAKMAAAPLLAAGTTPAPSTGGMAGMTGMTGMAGMAGMAGMGTVPSLSEVDMDSMASMMNMATVALAAGSPQSLPKIPLPVPVGKAPTLAAASPAVSPFVPPGRVMKETNNTPRSKEELPTSTTVKVTDDEGKLSLDEMVKKVGEKVNKAGGLTAIGYGAAKGKPYVRGRPKANSVIADDYREGPYSRGKGKGDSGNVPWTWGWSWFARVGRGQDSILVKVGPFSAGSCMIPFWGT